MSEGHAFDLTPEQLEALREPWKAGGQLEGLAVLKDAASTGRPATKIFYGGRESVGRDCLVIFQRLKDGGHRAVIFATDGTVLAQQQDNWRSAVERWVLDNTEPSPVNPNRWEDE